MFVTPTEPLAVQVAAMFSKLKSPTTHLPVFKGVGLAVPSRTFPPDRFSEKEVDIVVGTATALETILTSKRTLGFNFNYAVFDEVHNLNGEEGGALERIIRLIDCPFLALSATIKNVSKIQKANGERVHHVYGKHCSYRHRDFYSLIPLLMSFISS